MHEATNNIFHLTCRLEVKKRSFIDEQSDGKKINREDSFVFLVPIVSTEQFKFLAAWLPDTTEEHTEIAMSLGYPFACHARGAVMRANKDCKEHHIFLMSYGVAQLIREQKTFHNKEISVVVFPDSDDDKADLTFEASLPFEKKKYD